MCQWIGTHGEGCPRPAIYEEHYHGVNEQMKRVPKQFPELVISDELKSIDAMDESMFSIKNYKCYSPIKAPMKV